MGPPTEARGQTLLIFTGGAFHLICQNVFAEEVLRFGSDEGFCFIHGVAGRSPDELGVSGIANYDSEPHLCHIP